MFIAKNRRPTHSLLVLLIMLLGLTAAPAALAAQDDDADDDTAAPTEIVSPEEDAAGTDDADLDDQEAPVEFIMPDEVDDAELDNEDPPDCDDGGWRIVTTEDNDGFASEDHCEDHVAAHGEDSLVLLGANEDDAYIALTLANAGSRCSVTLTLVNGRPDQVISVTVDTQSGQRLLSQFTPATGDVTDAGLIRFGDTLTGGSAKILTLDYEPTGQEIPIYPNAWLC